MQEHEKLHMYTTIGQFGFGSHLHSLSYSVVYFEVFASSLTLENNITKVYAEQLCFWLHHIQRLRKLITSTFQGVPLKLKDFWKLWEPLYKTNTLVNKNNMHDWEFEP